MPALTGLAKYGDDAKGAVPKLIELVKTSDSALGEAAIKALQQIDPEAATKAGIR